MSMLIGRKARALNALSSARRLPTLSAITISMVAPIDCQRE
jgi:hypothetical protein